MTNQSTVVRKHSFKAFLSTVIAVLLIVSTFATTAFADSFNSYDVDIIVDDEAFTVTTTETEPIEILKNAGVTIDSDDKLDISSFDDGEGGEIVVQTSKNINVEQNSKIKAFKVFSSTVGDALKEAKITISKKDKANYELTEKVKSGMVITIKPAFNVSLEVDGATNKYSVIGGTVKDLLDQAGVKLGKNDFTKPGLNTTLKANAKVKVYRVVYKNVIKQVAIKYTTTKKNDKTLTVGKTKTVQKGKNGSKEVTYRYKYVNGEQDTKQVVSENIITKATSEIINVGTKEKGVKPNGVQSKNGISLGDKISGRYTHYCVCSICNGNSRGITASGRKIRNGMADPHYIACNWLPLGSVIKVNGTNYTVVDRGGSGLSRKGRIDIFTPGSHSTALKLGTANCTITIIRLGW